MFLRRHAKTTDVYFKNIWEILESPDFPRAESKDNYPMANITKKGKQIQRNERA